MNRSDAPSSFHVRRALLASLGLAVTGCVGPLPDPRSRLPVPQAGRTGTPEGSALLQEAARVHGAEAFARVSDINVSYAGEWFPLVQEVQPVLVDPRYRRTSEERLLVRDRLIGQSHRGPGGVKQVARWPGYSRVWYDGRLETDRVRTDAAELVADAYQLFLLGPLWLQQRRAVVELAGSETVDGEACDLLLATVTPGFGVATMDTVLAFVSRTDRTFRRVRFSLAGLRTTRGAVVEVDTSAYVQRGAMRFPTRFFERVKWPLAIDAHQWRLTGLDLDRGYGAADLREGPEFTWRAAEPATPLPG